MRPPPDRRTLPRQGGHGGFTLLEMVLAMFVLSLLLGGVFSIVRGTSQLADEMEQIHERDARAHAFAEFCERTFRSLPGPAQVRLKVTQSGSHYLSQLAMMDAPSPLGALGGNGLTILETEETPDGYLRIYLSSVSKNNADSASPGKQSRLLLLDEVSVCAWRFFNPRSNEWEPVWNENLRFSQTPLTLPAIPQPQANGQAPALAAAAALALQQNLAQRPGLIELKLGIGAGPLRRFVFWVPTAQSPVMALLVNPAAPGTAPAIQPTTPGTSPAPIGPMPTSGTAIPRR